MCNAGRGIALLALLSLAAATAVAADFGSPDGPAPSNVDEIATVLRQDPYDVELLVSYGTSMGGSAGHLALAIRDPGAADDTVYSANFYADRAAEHQTGFYTDELMVRVPKKEYLWGTRSSLGARASFGLDFGEIYKRSVIGIRVYGVPPREKRDLEAFFARINDDFHALRRNTDYHRGEVVYGYLDLNCAKAIGMAFRHGAGYEELEVENAPLLPFRMLKTALKANIPTEMAVKLMQQWAKRGMTMDVVLYRKFAGSAYVDPHEEEKVAFKDLPDRFPSVLSRDFKREQGRYEDADNLYAMYLLANLGRFLVQVDPATRRLAISDTRTPMPYAEASRLAEDSALEDSRRFAQGAPFDPRGRTIESR